ncbi:hypothetical protein CKM354_000537600 [Cercospora kikuchii]|uniref:Uncharacterized protein n=1 Tax=Cercospora kikuchii TaxID=84275 RepID=A0A9P3CHJ4_9PEZI|nr:uncharacterized protein CKM354_000537600 [Cercospora kikuchii]GIZ42096.1 hypothetical protein CKM354_000537600 [Cercospora kikuchii]
MEREQFADLAFLPLSYADGLGEIDRFYRTPEPETEREHISAAHVLDEGEEELHTDADDEFSTLLQDLEAVEGIEATDRFEPVLENSNADKDEYQKESSAGSNDNSHAPNVAKSAAMALTGQTPKASSPTIPMDLFASVKNTPGPSHSPIQPSSSNRSELQAEMRDEETQQNSPLSTPGAVPFSLARDRVGANSKRDASTSPLATRRPAKKLQKAGAEETPAILTGSPSASSIPPPRFPKMKELASGATLSALDADMVGGQSESESSHETEICGPKAAQHEETEGGARRKTLLVTMPLPQQNRRGESVATMNDGPADSQTGAPTSDAISKQEASEALPKKSSLRARPEGDSAQDSKPTAREAAKEPKKSAARTRRTMGAHELKDILDTNSRKGVTGGMSPRRMTRGQKQEREAAGPNAKEAVKRRRKSSAK